MSSSVDSVRTRPIAVAVAAALVIIGNGIALGLAARGQPVLGGALALSLLFVGGALGAFFGAGERAIDGWLTLVIGGTIGAAVSAAALTVLESNSGWLIIGVFSLVGTDVAAVALAGGLGYLYWLRSAAVLRSGTRPRYVGPIQTAGLATITVAIVVGLTTFIRQQPNGIYVRNETTVTLRFYEAVGNTWYQLGGEGEDFHVFPGRQYADKLIAPGYPRFSTAPGGLDSSNCTTHEIAARDPAGSKVASHPPGLCDGETWVVALASPPP